MALISAFKTMNNTVDYETAYSVKDITSNAMKQAIQTWYNLYYNDEIACNIDPSQRTPYVIIDGLYKAIFGEYEYSLDETTPVGKIVKTTLDNLDKKRAEAFQQAGIGGESFLKPIIRRDNFIFSVIKRNAIAVIARDSEGNITDAITSEITTRSEGTQAAYYTLLERRTVDNNGYLTIENRLYKSGDINVLGERVALSRLQQYENLPDIITLPEPIYNIGLISVKMPMVNCVDGSQDAVSIYAAAVKKIFQIFGHEKRTDNEYELTEPHLVVSDDIQRRDSNGNLVNIPKYITPLIDAEPDDVGLHIWNPTPHQDELEKRNDQLNREVENIIGLRRGFLSKSDIQEFTATEIIATSSKMAHLIKDLQDVWSNVVPEVVKTCVILANIYNLSGWTNAELPEVSLEYGDGILYDEDKEFNRRDLLVSQSHLKPEYLLGWYFNMPIDTPEDLQAIRKKYMPDETESEDEI